MTGGKYIRIEAINENRQTAWSQPFFINSNGFIQNINLSNGNWYKGNMHTHTAFAFKEGWFNLKEMKDIYQRAGYDFVAFTDHHHPRLYDENTGKYLIPIQKILDVESISAPPDFVAFSGCEIMMKCVNSGIVHLLCINLSSPPKSDKIDSETEIGYDEIQKIIDEISLQGGFVIWHELFNSHEFPEKKVSEEAINIMAACQGYLGIEIFNSADEDEANIERIELWDQLLSRGIKVWGFANDDIHKIWWPHFKGYNMVQADKNTKKDLIEAIKKGSFYASTGLKIENISCAGSVLSIFAPEAKVIRFIGNKGKVLSEGEGNEADYDLKEGKANYRFNRQFSLKKEMSLISYYEFISEKKVSEEIKRKVEKRCTFSETKIEGEILKVTLQPYSHPPALEKILLDNDFLLCIYQEDLWYGVFFSFRYDKKLYNELVSRFDRSKQIHLYLEGTNEKVEHFFLIYLNDRKKMFAEMCFRLEVRSDDRETFSKLKRFFLNLRKEIENFNFQRLIEIEDYYWENNKILKIK